MFESLQANQHAKTGVSQMAVFNDLDAVKAARQKWKKAEDDYLQARTDIMEQESDNIRRISALEKEIRVLEKAPENTVVRRRALEKEIRVLEQTMKASERAYKQKEHRQLRAFKELGDITSAEIARLKQIKDPVQQAKETDDLRKVARIASNIPLKDLK
jgi:vacuolar-type H+-ATPase subunit I/STV1